MNMPLRLPVVIPTECRDFLASKPKESRDSNRMKLSYQVIG